MILPRWKRASRSAREIEQTYPVASRMTQLSAALFERSAEHIAVSVCNQPRSPQGSRDCGIGGNGLAFGAPEVFRTRTRHSAIRSRALRRIVNPHILPGADGSADSFPKA
jgi:hypothetical protein